MRMIEIRVTVRIRLTGMGNWNRPAKRWCFRASFAKAYTTPSFLKSRPNIKIAVAVAVVVDVVIAWLLHLKT